MGWLKVPKNAWTQINQLLKKKPKFYFAKALLGKSLFGERLAFLADKISFGQLYWP